MCFASRRLSVFSVLMFLVSLASPSFELAAQRRPAGTAKASAAAPAKASAQKCVGGWRGVVTLRKTLVDSFESDQPGIRKAMDRVKQRTSRDYRYAAKAVIDAKDAINVDSKTTVNFTDKNNIWGEERVFDACNSRESGHWFIIEGTDNRETTAEATGPARHFNLTVNEADGTYMFSMKFPKAEGRHSRIEQTKRSGHCQAKNNEPFNRTTNEAVTIEGESVSVYGEKLDPTDPNKISGTKTWGDDGTGAVRSFVYTATWTFTRCPESLLVTDLKFEEMRVPDWSAWQEVTPYETTIDGNIIRITAKVLNLSNEVKYPEVRLIETYKGDKWNGAMKDYPLVNPASVRLEPGEEREVEWIWDSQGYAWMDDGRPRLHQDVRAEAWDVGKKKDSMTRMIRVAPKPLVLVAGLWSNPASFDIYQNILTASHSYDWKAAVFTREPKAGGASVYDNAESLAAFIRETQKKYNAWHVDLVAHSTGGLVGRLYIHRDMEVLPDSKPLVKHFLMLGTPNRGVACADSLKFLNPGDQVMRTAKEILPEEMERFNQFVTERKDVQFSALIGNGSEMLCASWEPNDGFVAVQSAIMTNTATEYTTDGHRELVEPKHFGTFIKPHVVTGPKGTYPIYLADRQRQMETGAK